MGKKHILVVHGNDCLDEITTTTTTHICEVKDNKIKEYEFNPENYGIPTANIDELAGGNPQQNAEIIKLIFSGKGRKAERDIVIINAAAGIYVSGKVNSWQDAITIAIESIDSGKAMDKLKLLIETSND